jgi:heat shock protein HslJ
VKLALLVVVSLSQAALVDSLANLSYIGIYDQPITLVEGRFEGAPFEEGGSSRPSVILADLMVSGDLTADGTDEHAALLVESSGGSGSFTYLAVIANRGAELVNVDTTLIGDRVQVRSLAIENGYVQLEYLTTGPGEGACCPSRRVRQSFGVEGDSVTDVFKEELGQISAEEIEGVTWRAVNTDAVQTLLLTGRNLSGSAGCNTYFAPVSSAGGRELGIGPPATTRRMCPAATMELERQFLDHLGAVEQFGFMMGKLALVSANEILLFEVMPED